MKKYVKLLLSGLLVPGLLCMVLYACTSKDRIVTMSGSLLCETAVVPAIYMDQPGNTHHEYVFYAVKGAGYVDKTDFRLRFNDRLSVRCKYIPAGSFFMGSPFYQAPRYQDEYPHKVTLTKSFYMTEVPITQAMWIAVMGSLPVPPPAEWGLPFTDRVEEGDNKAVEFANWSEIQEFCKRLSHLNLVSVRLPTAAEWEYAARAGSSSPPFAAKYTPTAVGYNGIAKAKSGDVRQGEPNPYGLYDMLSNGWHTVLDYKNDNTRHEQTNPTGIKEPWQANTFHSLMHQSKGGYHYALNQPNMHGANGEDGGLWEGGSVIFRVIIEYADSISYK